MLPSGSWTYTLDAYPCAPNNPSAAVRAGKPGGERVEIGRLDHQAEVVHVLARALGREQVDDRLAA